MLVAVECPDFLMSDGVGVVIYFNMCNLKCKYCDYRNMIKSKDLKFVKFDELFKVIEKYLNYVDNIIITGGEPLLFKNEVVKIIDFTKKSGKGIWLYTNLFDDIDDILNDIDKVVVDVKGTNVIEIMCNCECDSNMALNILENYVKYCNNDKFIFRVSDCVDDNNIKFKNIEKYEVKGL